MKKHIQVAITVILVLTFAGCQQNTRTAEQATATELRVNELESKIHSLEKRIEAQDQDIEYLKTQSSSSFETFLLRAEYQGESEIILDLTNKNYQPIRTNHGILLVNVENVEPYLDGSKITFRIGNMQSAIFKDMKMNIEWATRYPKYDKNNPTAWRKKYSDWQQTKTSKEFTFSEIVKAGEWNQVSCVLDKLPPNKLGHIRMSMEFGGIILKMQTPTR